MVCEKCGVELNGKAKFCSGCGLLVLSQKSGKEEIMPETKEIEAVVNKGSKRSKKRKSDKQFQPRRFFSYG